MTEAKKDYATAIGLDPEKVEAYFNLGVCVGIPIPMIRRLEMYKKPLRYRQVTIRRIFYLGVAYYQFQVIWMSLFLSISGLLR